MPYDRPHWKERWDEVRRHYEQWWRREGPVLRIVGLPGHTEPRDKDFIPPQPKTPRERHTDPDCFAGIQRNNFNRARLLADNLPIAFTDCGTVQLAAVLGSEPEFDDRTVWYNACISDPDSCPELIITKTEPWWLTYKTIMLKVLEISRGDYLVGMPAFGSNLDVLAELRGTSNLLYDLVDRPDWVKQKLEEINQSFFIAYDDYYEHIRLADGSTSFTYFNIWGPGKVSQVQCDFSAMISPDMFLEFVVPHLRKQCAWLDLSLYHLDGVNAVGHLKHLLAIPEIDVIQWTPGAGQEGAGSRKWYGMYEEILGSGKSLQISGPTPRQAMDLLDTFGSKGLFLNVWTDSETDAGEIIRKIDSMR